MRRLPLNSVRNRLVLLFFAITGAAIAFIYVYVVPQLRTSLTAEKLQRLEVAAVEQAGPLEEAMRAGATPGALRRLASGIAQDAGARATLLGVPGGEQGVGTAFVIADSEDERTALLPGYVAAPAALMGDGVASGVENVRAESFAQTALAVPGPEGEDAWVAVLSSPLDDVDANVALIRRQILIAGAIALAAAALAGLLAARAHSRRLRRLERAAEQVAEGNFSVPIPIDSTDEVGQLAMTFDEMQRRLARLDSARREFIANASHELRTPIFSLGGFVELLETDEVDPDSRREFVATMRGQIDRLTKLAADLLDLSKLDADAVRLNSTEVDLGRLAEEVVAEFGPAAERHGSSLTVQNGAGRRPPVALADRDRVAQIMRILIDNAIQHTPEGTSITVTTEERNGAARLTVTDDGPGIGAAQRPHLFERFYTGSEARGSGLGLAIARELAELMGGNVAVRSQGGRTDFTLGLRAAAGSERRAS